MESTAHFDTAMIVALVTMVLAYIAIFTEIIHRSSAALVGAVVMVGVGSYMGFYSQAEAVLAIDANTMFLLISMMMIVVMLRPTGGFEYLAIKIAKASGKDPRKLLVFLCMAVSVISMFLDNVTTVLIFAPLTVLITRLLDVNPMPYLMAEAMLSNIGGAATLVGDPPNIMIGSAAGIDFLSFMVHMLPIISAVWFCTVGLVIYMFRDQLSQKITIELDLDESKAIKDPVALKKALFALTITILLFFVHHHFHLFPAYVAFIGAALALVLVQPDPEKLYGEMEWSVLAFFAGLFVIVGGVEGSGLLDLVGEQLSGFAKQEGQLLLACLLLIWASAILSAIVDNIPFTVTMIPIVLGLEAQGVPVQALWWALAIGVGIGGNGSHIGATANVICVTESERCGIPEARITPMLWLRKGLPIMLFSLVISTILFALGFDYLR